MELNLPLAALLGLGTAVGLVLLTAGLTGQHNAVTPPAAAGRAWWPRLAPVQRRVRLGRRRVAAAVAVGTLVAVLTRWPVAAAGCAAAACVLPDLIGPDRVHTHRLARIDAIATFTESLRDNLSAAAGLQQSLTASAVEAPHPIREEVNRMAIRLRTGWPLPHTLRSFAADLADPTGDLVVAGLLMAAEGSGRRLAETLTELAACARATIASRQRVAAARHRNRTSARVILAATAAMGAGLVLLNRGYLTPFDSPRGQLVLLFAGACFAIALWWLARLMTTREPARLLAGTAHPGPADHTCTHHGDRP
jgi:tight adherence protein B